MLLICSFVWELLLDVLTSPPPYGFQVDGVMGGKSSGNGTAA